MLMTKPQCAVGHHGCSSPAAAAAVKRWRAPAPLKNIVLVHGAWVDASGWKPVYEILTKEGFHVTMVQEPETSFADDVAATKRRPRSSGRPHAARRPQLWRFDHHRGRRSSERRRASCHVAAHAPDVGEDEAALGKKTPSVLAKTDGAIKVTPDGFTYLDPAEFPKLFAPDLPRERAEFVARSQVLAAAQVFTHAADGRRLEDEAELGIVAGGDKIINPDLERWYYARAKSQNDRDQGRQPLRIRIPSERGRGSDQPKATPGALNE